MKKVIIAMAVGMVLAGGGILLARNVMDTGEQKLLATNKGDLGADAGFLSKYVQPYQIDEAHANTNFFRWQSGDSATIWIVRVTTSGTVTTWEKGTGVWSNRTSVTYEAIND